MNTPTRVTGSLAPETSSAFVFKLAPSLIRRPDLWATAVRSYRSLVPHSWWRQRPFLPIPNADWLHFRLVTAYGGTGIIANEDGTGPSYNRMSHDLILWLEWLRDWRQPPSSTRS